MSGARIKAGFVLPMSAARIDSGVAVPMGAARIKWALVLLALAAAAPHAIAQPSGSADARADARADAFTQSGCAACHGADGAGTAAGPPLAGSKLTLNDFTAAVRRGIRTMPGYGAQALPDERVAEIHAYLQAQRAPAAAAGRADSGARLFAAYGCYSCHANEAQGGVAGARLGPGPISFARFEWYVRHPTAQMPPYSTAVVSAQDVADIYAFVASRPKPPRVEEIPLLAP